MVRMSAPPVSNSTDFRPHLEAALRACDGAGRILNSHFGNLRNLDEKFQAGLVSDADRESEKFIIETLRSAFPTHSFLGEETGLTSTRSETNESLVSTRPDSSQGAVWMIDPLDGTTNFVHQFPFFCISIGLEVDGELVVGVVDAPKLNARFHAIKGQGAWMNGERLRVSERSRFQDGLFATGFSAYDNTLDEQLELLSRVIRQSRGIRRAGAAALDLCFVAQGIFDGFWERNLSPWDTAAGVVIAREAGAIATDFEGRDFNPRMKSILCGNPPLHGEIRSVIQQIRRRFIK